MNKIKLILIIINILLLAVILQNCATGVVNIDQRQVAVTIDKAYLRDTNQNGFVDQVECVFTKAVLDSSVTKSISLKKWLLNDRHADLTESFTGTANDNIYTFAFPEDTSININTTYNAAQIAFLGDNTIEGYKADKNVRYMQEFSISKDVEKDGMGPVIKAAYYYDTSSGGSGVTQGDFLEIIFSEPLGNSIDLTDDAIRNIITFNDSSTISDLTGDNAPKATNYSGRLRITLGLNPTFIVNNADLSISGSSKVRISSGTDYCILLKDSKNNPVAIRRDLSSNFSFVDIINNDTPTLVSAKLIDRDFNGRVDAIDLTFNESILDSSIVASKWKLFYGNDQSADCTGYTTATAEANVVNDRYVRILYDTTILPVNTTASAADVVFVWDTTSDSSITDLYSYKLEAIYTMTELDGIGPIISSATLTGNTAIITFSENTDKPIIDDASNDIDEYLELNNGHSWLDGNGGIGSVVWNSSGNQLTITLTTNGGAPTVADGDTITLGNISNKYIKDNSGNISYHSKTID